MLKSEEAGIEKKTNSLALAFLGDAVFEVYVRSHLVSRGGGNADRLHRAAVKYVCAQGQAKAIKAMYQQLSKEEQGVAKRGRNHKVATKPKNVDPMTYKWATALEALIGYLYLAGRVDRLEEVMVRAMDVVDGKP